MVKSILDQHVIENRKKLQLGFKKYTFTVNQVFNANDVSVIRAHLRIINVDSIRCELGM